MNLLRYDATFYDIHLLQSWLMTLSSNKVAGYVQHNFERIRNEFSIIPVTGVTCQRNLSSYVGEVVTSTIRKHSIIGQVLTITSLLREDFSIRIFIFKYIE